MSDRPSLGARLRYRFDKSMASGPIALIGWLALISLAVIVFAATILAVTAIAPNGGEPLDFIEAAWAALMRSMDAGTMGGDTGWGFRLIALAITIAGIFIFSTLIGVLSSGIEGKLGELRKGRSKVLERDHTIILNWSSSVFDIISELAIANQSRKRAYVVVMANRDKVEMEDEIKQKVGRTGGTRIICRSGDPTDLHDLAIVNPQTSRSIVVLSPDGEDPDSQVIKTVLALVNDPQRRRAPYQIAAEIREKANIEVARIVGGSELQLVLADDLISRIIVQSSRQAGLSAVYSELLDFDGCEIYTAEQPELVGKSFGEAVMAYDNSTLIGVCDRHGKVYLNPPSRIVLPKGVKTIIIAEDDTTIKVSGRRPEIDEMAILDPRPRTTHAERLLLLGWNRRGPMIVRELCRYVAPGSLLTVAAYTPTIEQDLQALALPNGNLSIELQAIDTSSRNAMERLDVPSYDHVLVLGYSDHLAPQAADTKTLIALLHLRRIAESASRTLNVVSEMIDVRNRELAEVTKADDFVVSNRLVSLMLAQASENAYLSAIFESLLDEKGSEIYLRPIGDYVDISRPLSFHTIAESARRRGEIAIGHRRKRGEDDGPRNMGGVAVNPPRNEMVDYAAADRVIVIARG